MATAWNNVNQTAEVIVGAKSVEGASPA
jgi:hypothetical protein